jgi:hypothetical protein
MTCLAISGATRCNLLSKVQVTTLRNNEQVYDNLSLCIEMGVLEERIATLALRKFDDLPAKSKPRIHPDGSREWVPMSAIVLVRGTCPPFNKPCQEHTFADRP